MRGKVARQIREKFVKGITPAYAGKRAYVCSNIMLDGDHPRLCGEKEFPRNFSNCITGSPPPMRGKVLDRQIFPIICRITPAYAGKSVASAFHGSFRRDHPRLCGEKFVSERRRKVSSGITPAYAGKRKR